MIPAELQQLRKEVTNAHVKEEHHNSSNNHSNSNNGHRGLDLSSPTTPKNPLVNQQSSTNGQYMSHKREGYVPRSVLRTWIQQLSLCCPSEGLNWNSPRTRSPHGSRDMLRSVYNSYSKLLLKSTWSHWRCKTEVWICNVSTVHWSQHNQSSVGLGWNSPYTSSMMCSLQFGLFEVIFSMWTKRTLISVSNIWVNWKKLLLTRRSI